jgi:thymidylate kinase
MRPAEPLSPWIVVTGLDGAGKTTLVRRLASACNGLSFRLPYHDFVRSCLIQSGNGLPFGDVHTDRLMFALDARLANYQIRQWRREGRVLVSQRGWMDNFIFGAVQGVSYAETDAMLRTSELERPSALVYLVADPTIAYARVASDPRADKYETPDFLVRQYAETIGFYKERQGGQPALEALAGITATLIDTTTMSPDEVFIAACAFLKETVAINIQAA